MRVVLGAEASDFDADEPADEAEAELVASFFDMLHWLGEDGDDLEPGDRIRRIFDLTKSIKRFEEAGFLVFAGRIPRDYSHGNGSVKLMVATVRVKRFSELLLDAVEKVEKQKSDPGPDSRAPAV